MDDTLVLGLNIEEKKKINIGKVLWASIFTLDIIFGIILTISLFGRGELLLWFLVP